MPETTKTAEDKLMADIAEAMTGSPLTLDSNDDSEPYRLPENFFAANQDSTNSSAPQSAEDKLIANISQAISESPIGIAQNNAHQNLEDDLNPFDEMPVPDPVSSFGLDDEPVESEEDDEPFLPDFSAYQNVDQEDADEDNEMLDPFSIPDLGTDDDSEQEQVPEPAQEEEPEDSSEDNEMLDPFAIPDFGADDDNEQESTPEPAQEEEPEDSSEDNEMLDPFAIPDFGDNDSDSEPALSPEADISSMGIVSNPVDLSKPEPESEPLTAEDRLAQEIAAFSQQDAPENIDIDSHNEEESIQDNMPEDSLLTDNEAADFEDDDGSLDMSSFGDAASIYDENTDPSHEEFTAPELQPEPEEITPSASYIADAGEQKERQKTMGIRDKLKAKKDGASSGRTGLFTNILLTLLLIVGGLLLWQLHSLSDKLTLAAMNSESLGTVSGVDQTPATYDYAIDFILDPNIPERMAARGREGWQVVGSMRNRDSMTGQPGYEFIFMRRRTGR